MPFALDPSWSFSEFLDHLFAHYKGGGIQSTGYRLNMIRMWLSAAGRSRATKALRDLEAAAETGRTADIAESLWMSESSYKRLRRFVNSLPERTAPNIKAFIAYKWDSGEHVAWVRHFAADLRARGIETMLDQWDVRYGESFTTFMQRRIREADVILFVISPGAVAAAEAVDGRGGALQFEVQMMNARRMAEGVRIIGVYRSGTRPPQYLADHRYVDFRSDGDYETSLRALADDLLGRGGPPPVRRLASEGGAPG